MQIQSSWEQLYSVDLGDRGTKDQLRSAKTPKVRIRLLRTILQCESLEFLSSDVQIRLAFDGF